MRSSFSDTDFNQVRTVSQLTLIRRFFYFLLFFIFYYLTIWTHCTRMYVYILSEINYYYYYYDSHITTETPNGHQVRHRVDKNLANMAGVVSLPRCFNITKIITVSCAHRCSRLLFFGWLQKSSTIFGFISLCADVRFTPCFVFSLFPIWNR